MRQKECSGYRPALDGLRAVAVGAVIVYHLRDRSLHGGFLGVDLFFVLSGYLITGLLFDEHARTGRINLPAFWARRARRLLPALLVVVVAVTIAVHVWAPVSDWPQRRGDLLATIFYYANWHMILSDQSYFTQFAPESPLRHAWSLAIEEQFYLVWPLLVLVLLCWRRRWMPAMLAVGTAASAFAMVMLWSPMNPTRAYAGTDARVQQLLIGALLALAMRRLAATPLSPSTRRSLGRAAKFGGPLAAAVTVALMMGTGDSGGFYYHGGATVIAVVMAVLIWAVEHTPESPIARVLSTKPLRWLGQISYGLYLWHWPVIGFAPGFLPGGAKTQLVLTLVLATVSYYLVERPVRRGWPRFAVGTPLRLAATVPATLGSLAAVVVAGTTWTSGLQKQQLTAMDGAPCGNSVAMCWRVPAPPGRPVIAVVGDSTAMALDPGFVDLARRRAWGYVLAAKQGCGVSGLAATLRDGNPPLPLQVECARDPDGRLRKLLNTYHPSIVFALSNFERAGYAMPGGKPVRRSTPQWNDGTHDALRHFAEQVTASGAKLVTPGVLSMSNNARVCLASNLDTKPCSASLLNAAAAADAAVNAAYERIAREVPGVHIVAMRQVICPGGTCPMVVDGLVPRYDGSHFTPQGARWFVGRMAPLLPDADATTASRPRQAPA